MPSRMPGAKRVEPQGVMVTHLPLFLAADGQVRREPGIVREIAEFLTRIVVVGSRRLAGKRSGQVACRVGGDAQPCPGRIATRVGSRGWALLWSCPVCGDSGEITGWAGTRWDRSGKVRKKMKTLA